MNANLLTYLQNQIATANDFIKQFTLDSWGNDLPARDLKGVIDEHVSGFLRQRSSATVRWVTIPGLRGVGKTTLLAQVYAGLSKDGDRANLLYISLDMVVNMLNSNLYEALNVYEQILGCRLIEADKPVFLFIDEVQADEKWAVTLKSTVYDKTKNVFILCTGSSATNLQMNADIAGRRALIEKLYPLSFAEYQLLAKGRSRLDLDLRTSLLSSLYYATDAADASHRLSQLTSKVNQQWVEYDRSSLLHYLRLGNLPVAISQSEHNTYQSLRSMVDKIIDTDLRIFKRFDSGSLTAIRRLLFALAEAGDVISLTKLADITGVSAPRLHGLLDALVQAELLIKIPAYGNYAASSRKPARYQFASPAIRSLHYDMVGHKLLDNRRGPLLEDAAALHYNRDLVVRSKGMPTHYYDKKQPGHCDFLLIMADGRKIAVEVGLGRKNTAQVERTIKQTNAAYGLVFADVPLSQSAANVLTVPLDYFFLL